MGPRAVARGNERRRGDGHGGRGASMGPRAVARENEWSVQMLSYDGSLQWGREQLLAEIGPEAVVPVGPRMLQWGREQLLAEMVSYFCFSPMILPCFNGAASSCSRKY